MVPVISLAISKEFAECLLKHKIKFEEYILLQLLYHKAGPSVLLTYFRDHEGPAARRVALQSLVRKQLIALKGRVPYDDFNLEDYVLTEYGERVSEDTCHLVEHKVEQESGDLIDQYLALFPQGVKNGGHKYLRSHPVDVRSKLSRFQAKYKYEPELIIKATKSFLAGFKGDYTYCPTAEYLIMKGGTSALATECERLQKGEEPNANPFQKRM